MPYLTRCIYAKFQNSMRVLAEDAQKMPKLLKLQLLFKHPIGIFFSNFMKMVNVSKNLRTSTKNDFVRPYPSFQVSIEQ